MGGRTGSEADAFTLVPAMGTASGEQMSIPTEVKYAHNPEARTALKDQLSARYLPEAGTDGGVFVLVWIDNPDLDARYKPLWPSIEAAEAELKLQAAEVTAANPGRDVRVVIVDVSLPSDALKDARRAAQVKRGQLRSRPSASPARARKVGKSKPTTK